MEMPRPTEAHRRLERFVGSWAGEETMHPSPWDPKGGIAQGRLENRSGLSGFVVIGDYAQERDGRTTFEGHSVYAYDTRQRCYVLHWFDCMGGPPEEFRGNFDGDILTVISQGPRGQSRMTYDLSGEDEIRSRMDMSPDGKRWSTLFEARYLRRD